MLKKILSLIVLTCMTVSMLSLPVFADDVLSGTCGDNVTWVLSDGTLTISGSGATTCPYYNIPWSSYGAQIVNLVIEDGVTNVGNYTYSGLYNLVSAKIGKDVKTVESGAFANCTNLSEVSFSSGITSIGTEVFSSTAIYKNEANWYDGLFYVGTYVFAANNSLIDDRTVIKDGTEYLMRISSCSNMKVVEVPESVVSFDSWSFPEGVILEGAKGGNAEKLAENTRFVFFETGAEHVKTGSCGEAVTWSLDFDSKCLTVSGEGSMTDFGYREAPWYKYYSYIDTIEIKSGVTSIGKSAFDELRPEKIIIADSVTEIKADVYKDSTICGSIGSYAETFAKENGLMFSDPEGNTIATGVCGESAVWSFNLNKHTLTISGSGAMTDYDSYYNTPWYSYSGMIDEIVIGDGITHLGNNAFYINSYQGVWIVLPENLGEINESAFRISNAKTLFYCPKGSYAATWAETNATNYEIYGEYTEIRVETTEELLGAIGSNRKIIMADGIYETDEKLKLTMCRDLTITAENSGKAEILSRDGYKPVVDFNYSCNVMVDGLILGHRSVYYQEGCGGDEYSSGYVVEGQYSKHIKVTDCDLYGCGTIGVSLFNTYGFECDGCVIRDCKENAVTSSCVYYPSRDYSEVTAKFTDCVISGNAYDENYAQTVPAMNIHGSTATFDKCTFLNNLSLVRDADSSLVKYTDCIFEDNVWQEKEPKKNGICLNGITWEIKTDKNEWNQDVYTLRLGFPLSYESGTVIESAKGTTLPYSEYSLPWKEFERIENLELAEGVKYGGRCGKNVYWVIDNAGKLTISGTGNMEFSGWSLIGQMIKSVVIESGVTGISNAAFAGCYNLSEVSISDTVTSIGQSAFSSCALSTVTLPANLASLGEYAFGYNEKLTEIKIADQNTAFTAENGILFNKDKSKLIIYPAGKTDASYEIPQQTKEIGAGAFGYAEALKSITIPEGVTTIGESAFQGSGLETLHIPSTVTNMQSSSLEYCFNLKAISVAENNPSFAAENDVLYNKDKTELILYPVQKEGQSFKVPSTVTKIADRAIVNVDNLLSISLPDGVKTIGNHAFTNCNNLVRIELPASVTEIGYYLVYPDSEATVFCDKDSYAQQYCEENEIKYSTDRQSFSASVRYRGYAQITAVLPSDRKTDGYVIAALYDRNDGSLIEVKKVKVEDDVIKIEMTKYGTYIKVLWWDIDNNVTPLAKAVVIDRN